MLRREDSTALRVDGLQFTSEGLIMTLDHRKTAQESQGREIAIVPVVDPTTCPLRALRDWIDSAKISSGPVFRSVDQKVRVSPSGLHRDSIGYILKRAAARAGMNVGIAGHSLRSGGITTAAGNGVPEYITRRQSRRVLDTGHAFRPPQRSNRSRMQRRCNCRVQGSESDSRHSSRFAWPV
jgi:hypothetical protein